MTATVISLSAERQRREFHHLIANMGADLAAMGLNHTLREDLERHLERRALRASRGLPNNLRASRVPARSGSRHRPAPPVPDCRTCGGSGEDAYGQRCVCTYNKDRAR